MSVTESHPALQSDLPAAAPKGDKRRLALEAALRRNLARRKQGPGAAKDSSEALRPPPEPDGR
jgi:hypothetical protein